MGRELHPDEPPTVCVTGGVDIAGDSIPYTFECPEDRVYDGWIIIEPGFGGIKPSSRRLRHELAVLGIAAASYGPSRTGAEGLFDTFKNPQLLHERSVGAIIDDIASNPKIVHEIPRVKSLNLHRVTHLPHSMGGHAAIRHAETHVTQTDALVSLATVGHGSPTIFGLLENLPLGIVRGLRHELIPYLGSGDIPLHPASIARIIHYFLRNPVRTSAEMISCLTDDLRPAVYNLGQLGVKTSYISFEHDCLIPPDESVGDVVTTYRMLRGLGHMAPQVEAKRVAREAADTLHDLHLAA
jgi:pimeloyl-ACP methyl ester carboxylesterase